MEPTPCWYKWIELQSQTIDLTESFSFNSSDVTLCLYELSRNRRGFRSFKTCSRTFRTYLVYLPQQTKQTKCSVHLAKTQIRLGGSSQCPVWSESSLCVQWIAKDPKVYSCRRQRLWSDWADVQDDLSLRWAHRSFCWFCHAATHIIWKTKVQTVGGVLGYRSRQTLMRHSTANPKPVHW